MVADYKLVDSESGKAVWHAASLDTVTAQTEKKGPCSWLGQWRSLAWDRAACVIAVGEPKMIDTKVQTSWWLPSVLAGQSCSGIKAWLGVTWRCILSPDQASNGRYMMPGGSQW